MILKYSNRWYCQMILFLKCCDITKSIIKDGDDKIHPKLVLEALVT